MSIKKKGISEKMFALLVVDKLPDIFTRKEVPQLLSGLISYTNLCVLENKGKGPRSHLIAGKKFYMKEEFVEWAREYYHVERTEESATPVQGSEGTSSEAG